MTIPASEMLFLIGFPDQKESLVKRTYNERISIHRPVDDL